MLSKYLNSKLKEKGWSIYHLHRVSNISYSYLNNMTKGKYEKPSYDILKKLAKSFNDPYETWLKESGYLENETNIKSVTKIDFDSDVQSELNEFSKSLSELGKEKQLSAMKALNLILKGMKIQL